MTNKLIHIIGGGTMFHLRNHFSLVAPAYGTTATQLASLCYGHPDNKMDIQVHLSKMCKQITPQLSPSISLFRGEIFETHQQLDALTKRIVGRVSVKGGFNSSAKDHKYHPQRAKRHILNRV